MPGELTPIRYIPEQHFEELNRWFKQYDEVIIPEVLPQIGFIIPGKAAGFLYRTDSALSWIENLIAPKDLAAEERSEALDAIVLALAQEARQLGFKALVGSTQLEAVVKRAQRLGFSYEGGGFHLIVLQL